MLRAFDELPVHTRQLAEMFRRHGRAAQRNVTDVQDLDAKGALEGLDTAWKGDWTPSDVVRAGKGDRPDPSEYLDADYIRQHLDQFDGGATRIYRKESLDDWGPGNNGTTYVFPTDQLDDVIKAADGDPRKLSDALGLPENFFVGADVELRDFSPQELDGLRMPTGNEGGTDAEKWIPGGYLPGGIPEAVIDIPETATGAKNGDYIPSFWPGSPRHLDL